MSAFIVFADDWGRHPSSCQHLFRRLILRHRTFWINTIGLRRPTFDLASLKRALEKLRQWTRRKPVEPVSVPANLSVSNPRMWPWFGTGVDRSINRFLLARHLRHIEASLSTAPTVVTTLPIVADLMPEFRHWRWVYYCVDDFSQWPGVDGKAMQRMEKLLVERCATIVAVSETLCAKLKRMGREAKLLTHGVDLEMYATVPQAAAMPEIAHLERPLIVFFGVIDRRMDAGWVQGLARSLKAGTVLLVGPLDNPDPALLQTPRVVLWPAIAYERLPALANEATALIMPYADLPVTRAMQPLKLKEYLATGKPAVVRDLPANRSWADCMDTVGSEEQFVTAVRERVRTGLLPEQGRSRERLSAEGWAEKARRLEQWLLAPIDVFPGFPQ